jgi:hypothetical protein
MISSVTTKPAEFALTITTEERAELLHLGEQAFEETRVEVHCTHARDYCNHVLQQEERLRGLIHKSIASLSILMCALRIPSFDLHPFSITHCVA